MRLSTSFDRQSSSSGSKIVRPSNATHWRLS
jgi:hypothetical protein